LAEASGRLVGPPVFKTGVGAKAPRRVRFPSASANYAAISAQFAGSGVRVGVRDPTDSVMDTPLDTPDLIRPANGPRGRRCGRTVPLTPSTAGSPSTLSSRDRSATGCVGFSRSLGDVLPFPICARSSTPGRRADAISRGLNPCHSSEATDPTSSMIVWCRSQSSCFSSARPRPALLATLMELADQIWADTTLNSNTTPPT
jgi:hypothetical protein